MTINYKLPKEIPYREGLWMKLFESKNRKLRMTDVGEYSITHPYMAKEFINAIYKYSIDNKIETVTCLDITSGLGGLVRYLIKLFDKCISVEKSELHFEIQKSNLKLLLSDDEYKKIYFVNSDFLSLNVNPVDVIICDPPWGGRDYRKHELNSLWLGEKNIVDVISDMFEKKKCKIFALLVMENYNFNELIVKFSKMSIQKVRNVFLILVSQ